MKTGITQIEFEVREDSYDRYMVVVNGERFYIAVVGQVSTDDEVRLCQMLQSLIDGELYDD